MRWNIVYYKSTKGISPVYDFIESLSVTTQAKISYTFDLLAQYGTALGPPHVKKLKGSDLWELRILGTTNVRIFYVARTGKTFLLIHGFVKKSQKTAKKEIKVALKRMVEYRARKK